MVLEWFIPAVLLILGLWITLMHRRLSSLRRGAITSWGPLGKALQQRHDLAAPLAQLVLSRAPAQKRLTEAMMTARNAALKADLSPMITSQAETRLANAMMRVFALAKTQSDLAMDPGFQRLQARFERLDDEITAAQDAFNQAALQYNHAAMSVPAVLVAKYARLTVIEPFGLGTIGREAMRNAARGKGP